MFKRLRDFCLFLKKSYGNVKDIRNTIAEMSKLRKCQRPTWWLRLIFFNFEFYYFIPTSNTEFLTSVSTVHITAVLKSLQFIIKTCLNFSWWHVWYIGFNAHAWSLAISCNNRILREVCQKNVFRSLSILSIRHLFFFYYNGNCMKNNLTKLKLRRI